MRQEIINYLKQLKLKTYKVSDELPFSNSGVALYLKNPKVLYVDEDDTENEPLIQILDGTDVEATTIIIRVFLTTDAKQQPADYDTTVSLIKNAKYIAQETHFRKECDVIVEYENDLKVTEFELRFTQIS